MNGFALPKYSLLCGNGDQMVSPVGPKLTVLLAASTSSPRLSRYHAASFTGSRDLKKIPPIPITRSMTAAYTRSAVVYGRRPPRRMNENREDERSSLGRQPQQGRVQAAPQGSRQHRQDVRRPLGARARKEVLSLP